MEVDQENKVTENKKTALQRKQCYRELLNKVEDLHESEDKGIGAVLELGEVLKEVNSLEKECHASERIENADETILDSMVLSSASSLLVKCIEAVDVFTSTYESTEFASKLISTLKEDDDFSPEDWLKILKDARGIIPEVPQFNFLYGTFEPDQVPAPKQKKQIQRQAQEKVEKKQLLQVKSLEKEEEDVNDTVKFLFRLLREEYEQNGMKPILYYQFVIDTEDFAKTVENMFYFSFLLRDGKVVMDVDDNGFISVIPQKKKVLEEFREKGGINTQMITSITMDTWQKMKLTEGIVQRHRRKAKKK